MAARLLSFLFFSSSSSPDCSSLQDLAPDLEPRRGRKSKSEQILALASSLAFAVGQLIAIGSEGASCKQIRRDFCFEGSSSLNLVLGGQKRERERKG